MKKIVLIDGNNFMFRSYYATAYTGKIMTNSKGFPTNALYGFVSMINKIISEEKPDYIAVAFDIGTNFRKQEFSFYKDGRSKTPDELKMQMPIARKLLTAMGIKYLELEPYEADDIIGTLVDKIALDEDFDATIISSDKDLLQLINFETDYKLLKPNGYIRYTEESFEKEFGIKPIKVIDLKALMGDSSDNIPGVKGIGEKSALKLLNEYGSLDGIYENIDSIKGSIHDKLVSDKENAYMSYKIATIYRQVPLDITLEDLKYTGNTDELYNLYKDLEFTSFLKGLERPINNDLVFEVNKLCNEVMLKDNISLYIECDKEAYNSGNILGCSIYDGNNAYYYDKEHINILKEVINGKNIVTFDGKKNNILLNSNIKYVDDVAISSYLLGYTVKDDSASILGLFDSNIPSFNEILKLDDDKKRIVIVNKAKVIFDNNKELLEKLVSDNMMDLYRNIEIPLINVLTSMELEGIKVNKDELIKQGNVINNKLDEVTKDIYTLAGEEFNISSPKQLGEILFEKMALSKGKKNKTGYKTDAETLEKMIGIHPIISKILDYRALNKLKTTYIDGLVSFIDSNSKIHTIYKQTIARTGRLSSVEPNLQNIPSRDEVGKLIKKAFIPSNDLFLSCDYSQIELRVLASLSGSKNMIDTFNNDGDIHTKVASDIHGIKEEEVTKEQRSKAKAVIFGIVYGISGYGLMENIHTTKAEADMFINKYFSLYPEVKEFMENAKNNAIKCGYTTTMFGRKRYIEELSSTNFMIRQMGERMAFNTPIQGTSADIIKMAMIKIYDEIINRGLKSKLILQIHDELIFDLVEEEKDELTCLVKDTMEHIVKLKCPLKVSSDIASNWYDIK